MVYSIKSISSDTIDCISSIRTPRTLPKGEISSSFSRYISIHLWWTTHANSCLFPSLFSVYIFVFLYLSFSIILLLLILVWHRSMLVQYDFNIQFYSRTSLFFLLISYHLFISFTFVVCYEAAATLSICNKQQTHTHTRARTVNESEAQKTKCMTFLSISLIFPWKIIYAFCFDCFFSSFHFDVVGWMF